MILSLYGSEGCAVENRAAQGYFVGIFQFVAHRYASGYNAYLYTRVSQFARDKEIGGITFHGRV